MKPKMSLVDVITKILVSIFAAVISGLVVLAVTPDWEVQAIKHGWVDIAQWHELARQQDWLPLEECPTIPVIIELTSPGNSADITLGTSSTPTIISGIVIVTSKPLNYQTPIGLLFKPENEINYYVVFPNFDLSGGGKYFRAEYVELPFAIEQEINVNVWAFYAKDRKAFGEIYTSLDQFQISDTVFAISKPLSWILHR